MPVLGTPRSFHKKFKFLVEIDGIGSAAFQSMSELSAEFGKVEHREGGVLIPNKSPGLLTFTDVTLSRGATQDRELYDWFREIADAAQNAGSVDDSYKRLVSVLQLDRDNSVLREWRLANAWIQKFVAGDWDNDAEEAVIEQTVLTYDYFELIQGGGGGT